MPELDSRQIDGNRKLARPVHRIAAGLPEHPIADRDNQADFLRHRDEIVRPDQTAFRMVPAYQRLEAADLAVRQVDQRLVIELEFAGQQRLAQIELEAA